MTDRNPTNRAAPATAIPPVSEADVLGMASMIIERFGEGAPRFAAEQMEQFQRHGNAREFGVWTRVGLAVMAQKAAPEYRVAA
jgi:hypothetical protein